MKKLTVLQAAEHFGISKEAIHNRIRRGSLEVVIENEQKFVLINTDMKVKTVRKAPATKRVSPDDRYYKLLEEQNAKLQEKVEKLEDETRSLRDQKELMLLAERQKIENIYKEKDEQLKNILSTISSQFMLGTPAQVEQEMLEVEVEEAQIEEPKLISLKKYMKSKKLSQKKRTKMKEYFKKRAKKEDRIILIDNKYYLDLAKYDYRDLV